MLRWAWGIVVFVLIGCGGGDDNWDPPYYAVWGCIHEFDYRYECDPDPGFQFIISEEDLDMNAFAEGDTWRRDGMSIIRRFVGFNTDETSTYTFDETFLFGTYQLERADEPPFPQGWFSIVNVQLVKGAGWTPIPFD